MLKNSLTVLIIFSAFAGCSHSPTHRMIDPNLSLNMGEPRSKIIREMYTDTYEFAEDETSKKFVLSNNPPPVKPLEKAIRINLSVLANNIRVKTFKDSNVDSNKSGEIPKPPDAEPSSSDTLTVYFDFNSYVISQPEALKLQSFIAGLKGEEICQINITGYTDSTGSSEINRLLAEKRAMAVADLFKKAGFSIAAHGKGKCCYIDPQNQQLNRRVEISAKKSRTRKEVVGGN